MTNTLHRQGTLESLKNDYVIFAFTIPANKAGSSPKIKEFMRICLKHHPVNMGSSQHGVMMGEGIDIAKLIDELEDGAHAMSVFTDLSALQKVVEELARADLGISINISGLLDGAQECCRKAGIERHSAEQSLGFWGSKDRLPERPILEINTMCGHGMVSFNLVRKMIDYVKLRRLTPKKAANIMAKCCSCGAFNPIRAEMLLDRVRRGE
jgi:hypothetical protein